MLMIFIFYLFVYICRAIYSSDYIYVISSIEALLTKYSPDYFVGGGDMNTDFSRQNSSHTKTLSSFCRMQNLDYVGRQNSTIEYTYESEMNNVRSYIDHFIISEILIDSVVKYCTFNDVDNFNDHLPLCLCFDIQMTRLTLCEARQFKSKPKWYSVNYIMLASYRETLDAFLIQINSCVMIECDVTCKRHESDIQVTSK